MATRAPTFMELALDQAKLAAERGEVPVGAVIVQNSAVIATSGNVTVEKHDPTGHAEIEVIRQACKLLESQRLPDCDLYVTLEPCTMCAAAISYARIRRLYFAAEDAKGGGVVNGVRFFNQATCHHAPEVYAGMCEQEASNLLTSFFADKRP